MRGKEQREWPIVDSQMRAPVPRRPDWLLQRGLHSESFYFLCTPFTTKERVSTGQRSYRRPRPSLGHRTPVAPFGPPPQAVRELEGQVEALQQALAAEEGHAQALGHEVDRLTRDAADRSRAHSLLLARDAVCPSVRPSV